ncbi:MAG: transcriptional regulator [Planctomycetaceae bacterium]|nr:transcriptional regulator [Planctomycetaceae bacterium]
MSHPSRLPESYGDDQPRELLELGRLISELPESQFKQLESAFAQVTDCITRRRRILTLVQEALAQLRLDIKYLMFDLEVTRRERDELKEQLDQIERDGYERF